jgi:hypothetical protein
MTAGKWVDLMRQHTPPAKNFILGGVTGPRIGPANRAAGLIMFGRRQAFAILQDITILREARDGRKRPTMCR